jgi:hypothetical protein
MAKYSIEDLKKIIGATSDDRLNFAISKGHLKLSDDEIGTVSFLFWLCYSAEIDLDAAIKIPWEIISKSTKPEVVRLARERMEQFVFGAPKSDIEFNEILKKIPVDTADQIKRTIKENFDLKRKRGIDGLESLTDKIAFYQAIFGENNVTKVLWEIKRIRNDISHNRIKELTYKDNNLYLRSTKEEILIDYLGATLNPDHSHSPFEKSLLSDRPQE